MIWQNGELKNPLSGKLLERDSVNTLTDGDERFPVIDEIPFLRFGRENLKQEVLRAIDLEDARAALILLFQDQDDWARTPPPAKENLQLLFDNPNLTLRQAMQILQYGAVADYFAYRWSDPTFLSGLSLLEWHLPDGARHVFELCCGIGHYLRELILRGISATGADVVFSKLWLARKFVAPSAKLVCCDASFALPFASVSVDTAFCHDAFYFLPEKAFVASELKRITELDGAILIGHAHNAEAQNFSSGAAVSISEYKHYFANPILYDDEELTSSIIENRHPQAQAAEDLIVSPAIAIVEESQTRTIKENNRPSFAMPIFNRSLRLNPLLENENQQILQSPRFPSERYRDEYADLSDYLDLGNEQIAFAEQAKAFYGDWSASKRLTDLVRRRIFLDLPEKW